ncbi:MAG: hypothetical protein A49_16050 [Methyloceanibacter sp.]|nr:MAG: hypothetical protein A49_16050 [Methyloceanibacter sp.]
MDIIERVVDLLIITVIDLGTGFLSRSPERAERGQFVSRLHQCLNAPVDDISQDIFALGGIEHRADEDAPSAATESVDVKMIANLWDVRLSQPSLLILLEGILGQQHAHRIGKVTHEAWRQRVKGGKIAQALKGFEQNYSPESGDRGFCGAFNECQIVWSWGIEFFEFLIAEIGADTRIRRLVNGGHGLIPD